MTGESHCGIPGLPGSADSLRPQPGWGQGRGFREADLKAEAARRKDTIFAEIEPRTRDAGSGDASPRPLA